MDINDSIDISLRRFVVYSWIDGRLLLILTIVFFSMTHRLVSRLYFISDFKTFIFDHWVAVSCASINSVFIVVVLSCTF